MIIKIADTNDERDRFDQLLWDILWAPLGLPRDIRQSFALDSAPVEFVAVEHGDIVGGLVANRMSEKAFEIRHIALLPDHQRCSIGTGMVKAFAAFAYREGIETIQAYARNTSLGFFMRIGFAPTGEKLTHPDFMHRGISFQKVVLYMNCSCQK